MKRMTRMLGAAILLAAMAALLPAIPPQQAPTGDGDLPVTASERTAIIESALKKLNASYVFPDVAQRMTEAVRARMARKEYDAITSGRTLASTLADHLRDVSHDKHLRVLFSFDPFPQGQGGNPELAKLQSEFNNFGFARVERLPGNVGYLDLRGFSNDPEVRDIAAGAMNVLANTRALIVDLRQNGGGSPFTVAFLSSYLFGPEKVHLNDLYWRVQNRTDSFYTEAEVPGRRFGPDKPVYVLTSNRTFSAAEEFTYNLQSLKRATIVGETTGGGAHPGGPQRITEHFAIWIPTGRAINPVTKKNWEGTGVVPDVPVAVPLALKTAYLLALKRIQAENKSETLAAQIQTAIANAERELEQLRKQ